MEVGTKVTIQEPFGRDFPGVYEILDIVIHEDGSVVCILDQDAGGFDPKFLEVVG